MNWVKTLVCGPALDDAECAPDDRAQLSRQELSDLFSDDLARPVLQKRTQARAKQPRRYMAGRQIQLA